MARLFIRRIGGGGVSVGSIEPFAGNIANMPDGFLFCDGSVVSRAAYPDLFAAIGTSWGAGDGVTTFHLPDMRGRFMRGRDAGAGRDPQAGSRTASNTGGASGDNVGSIESDAMQGHHHTYRGDFWGTISFGGDQVARQDVFNTTNRNSGMIASPRNDGANGDPRTSQETRPINANINYIIKAE
jgi:microcystin-dependent protein